MIKRVYSKVDDREYWRFDIYVQGRRVRESGFLTKDDARDAVAAIRADAKRGKYTFPGDSRKITIEKVGALWIRQLKTANRHPAYIRRAAHAFELLGKLCGSSTPVTQLHTKDLEQYARSREEAGVKRQTIFNDLIPIRAAFRYASDTLLELATWRPPRTPAFIKSPKAGRQRVLTPDEESRLLAELRRRPTDPREVQYLPFRLQTADLVELALHTGMRRSELLGLQWSDVHLERSPGYPAGWILCRATKTGDRSMQTTDDRVIPIAPAVAEILERRRQESEGRAYVFPATATSGAKGIEHQTQLHRALKRACEKAGIAYGRETPGGFVFHDLRHTAASRMLQSGADLRTVMDVLGHREVKTALRYTHSTPSSQFAAVSGIAAPNSPEKKRRAGSRPNGRD